MSELNLLEDWSQKKDKLKRKYPDLTDDDLAYREGKEDKLFERVQQRLGKSREETEKIIRKI